MPVLLQERPLFEFLERVLQLLLRIHHDGAIPGHGLFQRFPRNKQEANTFIACLNHDLVTSIKKYK